MFLIFMALLYFKEKEWKLSIELSVTPGILMMYLTESFKNSHVIFDYTYAHTKKLRQHFFVV